MTEQPVDIRSTLAVLRRRRLTLLLVLGTSVACAFAYTVLQPPAFVARSGVLLPASPLDENGKALRDMDTEVQVAASAQVLTPAGRAVTPPVSAVALRRKVSVRAVSTAVLEVQVSDRSARRAALLADAVASEYVAYSFKATSDESDTTIRLLLDQAATLDEQVRKLEDNIASNTSRLAGTDPNSGEALRITALIDAMRSQQVDAARQLATVNGRIADARLTGELSRRATRVLDSAVSPSNPAGPRAVRNLAVGGMVGLIAGIIVALVRDRRDRRLRTRDQLAHAAEAPVLASLSVPRTTSLRAYRKLLEKWVPAPVEHLALTELFARLGIAGHEPPTNVVFVTLPGDHAGSTVAIQLASFAAATGLSTALIVGSEHPTLARLSRTCSRSDGGAPSRENLRVCAGPNDVDVDDLQAADILITLLTHEGRLDIPTWGRRTTVTLAVSSGFATGDSLASVVLACLDAGQPLRGVLVVNPDPGDRTTGQLVLPISPLTGHPRRTEDGDAWSRPDESLLPGRAAEPTGAERGDIGAPGNRLNDESGQRRPTSIQERVQAEVTEWSQRP